MNTDRLVQSQICFQDAFQLTYDIHEMQQSLKDDQVLISTDYSLISPGTELSMYTGTHIGLKNSDNKYAKYPFYPGYAVVGHIVKKGRGVFDAEIGDKVYAIAKHAKYNICQWNSEAIKISSGMCGKRAVFARLATISMSAVYQTNISVGNIAVVFGMGLIGNFAAQLLGLFGAETIGVDIEANRLRIAEKTGICHHIQADKDINIKEEMNKMTGCDCADIVIEATGVSSLVNDALELVRPNGQVVLLGSPRELVEIDTYNNIHAKAVHLIGAHEKYQGEYGIPDRIKTTRYILNLIQREIISVDSLITHIIPANHANEAYDLLLNKKNEALGVLLDWQTV